jgi:TonB family protein
MLRREVPVNRRCLGLILAFVAIPVSVRAAEDVEHRRTSAANRMAKELSGSGIHRVYVPDSCDSVSRPNGRGAFFAATFSALLAKKVKGFAIESRVDAHRFLRQNNLTDCDLGRAEILSKFSSELGVDSVLYLNLTADKDSYSIEFTLRDLSGKELSRSRYTEPCYAETEALFPASAAASGWPFYFASLDGVSQPKGAFMPNVDPGVGHGTTGVAVVSALLDTNGNVDQIRFVHSLTSDIDNAVVKNLRTWRFVPAKDPDGAAVPVRLEINISFWH